MLRMPDNSAERLLSLVAISRISFLSLVEKINLLKNIDSSAELALMSIEDFRKFTERNIRVKHWDAKANLEAAKVSSRLTAVKGISLLCYDSPLYPALLRESSNAPFVLYCMGNSDCLTEKAVSVVGTRMVSPEGKKATHDFAYDSIMDGCNVVSGLAKGVDGEAHRGAVDAAFDIFERTASFPKAKTIAVLPCGIGTVVPSAHKKLAESIIRTGGCLVSEYAPGTPSEAFRFVQRNRIIAALSSGTVIMQAPNGSGSLLTAEFALEYNRDLVFHEVCFSCDAQKIREDVKKRQAKELSDGKINASKAERTVESFLAQGASVIKDYADYKKFLAEVPGTRSAKNQQFSLFEV